MEALGGGHDVQPRCKCNGVEPPLRQTRDVLVEIRRRSFTASRRSGLSPGFASTSRSALRSEYGTDSPARHERRVPETETTYQTCSVTVTARRGRIDQSSGAADARIDLNRATGSARSPQPPYHSANEEGSTKEEGPVTGSKMGRPRSAPMKVLSVIGTRPEAIKMAPITKALEQMQARIVSRVCVTAQHRRMLDQVLDLFGVRVDHDLDIMRPTQTPSQVLASAVTGLEMVFRQERPHWVLAEGDTTTVVATAMAAYHERIPFGHVEAGLRTGDKYRPFPEELNRRIADLAADLCFAPTLTARDNLLSAGIPSNQIWVTGNTVIDALLDIVARPYHFDAKLQPIAESAKRLILVTAHRRESFGEPLRQLCLAIHDIAETFADDVQLVYPVHLNPQVQAPAHAILGGLGNVALLPPLDYATLVHLLRRAYCVLTDSGGLQEEAPALGVPVLVMREVTERPEGIQAGCARLVGTRRDSIVSAVRQVLMDSTLHRRMAQAANPYGDGCAAARIVAALLGDPVEPFHPRARPDP